MDTPIARYVCDTGEDAAELLAQLVREDAGGPLVRHVAGQIRSAAGGALGPAIQAWVQRAIAYADERKETFQSAEVTIRRRSGDCDDHARLVLVIARELGVPAQLVICRRRGQPVHAVAKLRDDRGVWQWAETTLAAHFGEHPVEAKKRLNAAARQDLG